MPFILSKYEMRFFPIVLAALMAVAPSASSGETRQELFDALFQKPDARDLMLRYARRVASEGDFEAAVATLERLVDLEPANQEARLELARAYFALGQNAVAAQVLDRALAPLHANPAVEHVRTRGMIWAFDVKAEAAPGRFAEVFHLAGRRHELLIRPIGRTVYLMPPYVLNDDVSPWLAERLLATLHDTLEQSHADRTYQPPTA